VLPDPGFPKLPNLVNVELLGRLRCIKLGKKLDRGLEGLASGAFSGLVEPGVLGRPFPLPPPIPTPPLPFPLLLVPLGLVGVPGPEGRPKNPPELLALVLLGGSGIWFGRAFELDLVRPREG
jgi:hypothetical protein